MGRFVQIVEYRTSRFDEMQALSQEMRSEREGSGDGIAPLRVTVTADKDRPGHYLTIVEFASYEAAMKNSDRPETTAFAQRMAELCDGPPTFNNLDVVDVWEPST